MYPRRELDRLAARKALLQARLAVRRLQCQLHAAELAKPVQLVDRAWTKWRQVAPIAKVVGVPLGVLLARKVVGGGVTRFAGWLKFAPLAVQAARMFAHARGHSHAKSASWGPGR